MPINSTIIYRIHISEFSLNGMPRRLQRHGLKADGHYGKIDNLHIYFEGNCMTGVLEDSLRSIRGHHPFQRL